MDTTKQYILMCEKAEEIQKLAKDWFFGKDNSHDYYRFTQDKKRIGIQKGINIQIWLPRQDQLQEIYDNGQNFTHQNLEHFYRWYKSGIGKFFSMEQLWLAFVMWGLYKKEWTGKEWTTE